MAKLRLYFEQGIDPRSGINHENLERDIDPMTGFGFEGPADYLMVEPKDGKISMDMMSRYHIQKIVPEPSDF